MIRFLTVLIQIGKRVENGSCDQRTVGVVKGIHSQHIRDQMFRRGDFVFYKFVLIRVINSEIFLCFVQRKLHRASPFLSSAPSGTRPEGAKVLLLIALYLQKLYCLRKDQFSVNTLFCDIADHAVSREELSELLE